MSFKEGFAVATALASELTDRLDLPAAAVYYLPVESASNDLEVAVAYAGESTDLASGDRASNRKRYTIEVAVIKKLLKRDDVEELQPLIDICDEIKGLFEEEDETGEDLHRGSLRGQILGNASWSETTHEPLFIDEHLVGKLRQFTAVPTFIFQRITT